MTRLLRGALPLLILAAGCVGPAVANAAPTGPDLSFSQFPGGITVNVTDKSGTPSWCTYSAEWFKPPPFLLAANATYPLMIPFSAPDNKVWNVNVNCDNGASTHTTFNYVAGATDDSASLTTLSDLFTDLDAGLKRLQTESRKLGPTMSSAADKFTGTNIQADQTTFSHWTAEKSGMRVSFEQGTVAPSSAGVVELTIPWENLSDLLKPGVLQIVTS